MHGRHSPHFRPGADGAQPPSQPPPPQLNSNFAFQNPNFYFNNPALQFFQNLGNVPLQNPNFSLQSPNFPLENHYFPIQQPNLPQPQIPPYPSPQPRLNQTGSQSSPQSQKTRKELERIDRAVVKARRELIAAGESVNAWKVCQSALLIVKVDSWSSLGFQMQEVPSLKKLMVSEAKVNAFIHCFAGVEGITSLYDLEKALCKSEGVEKFEVLELGPFLKHPLILHYFSVNSDVTEIFKLSSSDIIVSLCEYMDTQKKKDVEVDEFLEILAKKKSLPSKEKLGVRIQNIGMYTRFIREARRTEDVTLKKFWQGLQPDHKRRKRPIINAHRKKQLDDRFSALCERVKSFSAVHEDFSGKHTRFVTSSSEEDESYDCSSEDQNDTGTHTRGSLRVGSSDQVSRCPYPSATEEIRRLGLKGETGGQFSPGGGSSQQDDNRKALTKKRKSENTSSDILTPNRLLKKNKAKKCASLIENDEGNQDAEVNEINISLSNSSMSTFVTTWKEACKNQTVAEVFRKMLQFYKPMDPKKAARLAKRLELMFSEYPFVGLLNVAVTSIKSGMWDSVYDTFQEINMNELTTTSSEKCPGYESIEIEPSKEVAIVTNEDITQHAHSVTVEELSRKMSMYFEFDNEVPRSVESPLKRLFILFRKLRDWEAWLAEQFSVNEFKHLGHGEFFTFLEKHASLLPIALQKFLAVDICQKSPLAVTLLQHLLVLLVSQASNNIWENENITEDMISALLIRQFPLLNFKIVENGSMEEFLEVVGRYKNDVVSKRVLFSETLRETCLSRDGVASKDNLLQDTMAGMSGSVTSKDAIEVLLKAPMLSDLYTWSHWDLVFAPSLGPLIKWLLNEVNKEELLCLVTKEGKIIRIDHCATADSFLDAAIQGSSFQTALKLLSTFALAGGEKHVPSSLLKCHARHAFEVIIKNNTEDIEESDFKNSLMYVTLSSRQKMLDGVANDNLGSEVMKSFIKMDKAVRDAAKFFLDCLGYLPSEFRGFVADVLLSGLRSVIKDATSAILCECNQIEQRVMLHELGLSLGITEWIHDYNAFRSASTPDSFMPLEASCSIVTRSPVSTVSRNMHNSSNKFYATDDKKIDSVEEIKLSNEVCCSTDGGKVSQDEGYRCTHQSSRVAEYNDAALIIESIRREEFGLDPNLSNMESSMLKKQHARLGRALHCLSQELYSQDSHFLLELVQNADDNIYPETVEPTLTFILQESGIVVLNNEHGFSAQNIKALCDVGNSTKKGSGAGYIGQKGIGFKSVFRVTDAPEIHSNGFHVKFDTSEGQIGFVLPTVVPPCDIGMLSSLVYKDTIKLDNNCWNTCIQLPFRSKLSEGTSMSNIVSMFSDLHPSLLLFLHRLQCIMFRNMLNDSLIVMRKKIVGDGIVKVSCGEETMTWFVATQKLQADVVLRDVQTTEIAIAFTLEESNEGNYIPLLEQQPVFAYLPLRTYGLKFIIQGDFVLPSSREEVDTNSPWNQWLLSEFPSLFVSAERSFCSLPCFRQNPAKAVTACMRFVPLVGEVHGFFSCLPRMIVSKLRMSSCLLLEGDGNLWVPPCKVLRGWNDQARILLPDSLLHEHLGLGFLNKDIDLSDSLARALGIEEYGPKILLQIISSLCQTEMGLKSMGLGWLSSWLNEVHSVLLHCSGQSSLQPETEADLINNLRRIPFIPLSDGSFSSVDDGTIWLHSDAAGFDDGIGFEAFPFLYARLRTVSPALLSASAGDISCLDRVSVDNISRMLLKMGVQQLSAHDIVKVHILPAISDERTVNQDRDLMIDYLCFAMFHLESSCPNCHVEKEYIVTELRDKAFILTNHGFKRPIETPIHFSKEFGNVVNVNKLNVKDLKWHEVDISYLKHPATESLSQGLSKWRKFLLELGITDFVQVVEVSKSIAEMSHVFSKNMIPDWELVFPGFVAKDYESVELVHLLSLLSANGNLEGCKELLNILDTLWENCYGDKTTGSFNFGPDGDIRPFKSSFLSDICSVQWVVSSMDNKLHFSKDLFHDCHAVRSILGTSAPYAVPKVKNEKLLRDIGLKTEVALHDIVEILHVWKLSEAPFKASISQMSKLYTCMWNEMTSLEQKDAEALLAGPFIYVPYASGCKHEEVVSGVFLSSKEVCWHDPTGVTNLKMELNPQNSSSSWNQLGMALCNVYPGLYEFFVKKCGVHETPSYRNYLQILLQLSTVALPSQAATAVFQVFLKWADGLKSRLMSSNDIVYLKECLLKAEYTVLPTSQDKWVSLHPSFGLVCWCDDQKLRKRFKHLGGIDFLYFGNRGDNEEETFGTIVSTLLQTLGIPSLSQLVTREAIHHGLVEGTSHASLINWALPYAQRYIFGVHPDKYSKLKQSKFCNLKQLQVAVVEKLFYRNVIKGISGASKKEYECSCLLQGTILYILREADSHSIYMELSRLFFDGHPELHLANFLHMITTMAESGSNEDQTEFFVLNCQKVPALPAEEPVWSLSSALCLPGDDEPLQARVASSEVNEQNSSLPKRKYTNWPPVDWKTAPDFRYARANGFRTQAAETTPGSCSKTMNTDNTEDTEIQSCDLVPVELDSTLAIGDDLEVTSTSLILPDAENLEDQFGLAFSRKDSGVSVMFDTANPDILLESPQLTSSKFSSRDQLNTGPPSIAQALRTGRLGERAAYKHFSETFGKTAVRWVNENNETGLPYDIVIEKGNGEEYIEVKATKSTRKDWFNITMREWRFAVEKGESFSIAHVVLLNDNNAKVTVYKNLVKLCQLGKLQLVVMMQRQQNEMSMVT